MNCIAGVLLLVVLLLSGCSDGDEGPSPPQSGIRVASFDFAESRLLAEVYAQALRRGGYHVAPLPALGPREIVAPALEQGLADLVPEYTGSALRFLAGTGGPPVPAAPGPAAPMTGPEQQRALQAALARRGLTALAPAPGQDQNGVVVSRPTAELLNLRTVSDLGPVAGQLSFGGPPECPERPLCLRGLQDRYGLEFQSFVPFTSRPATAEALLAGQLDVGVLETVDPYLADGLLVLLEDDLALQPAENVVPVVRTAVVDEHGPGLVRLLDRVSATLTTAAMVELNRQVVLEGRPLDQVAAGWVQRHGLGQTG